MSAITLAPPPAVPAFDNCYFYHTVDLPGPGVVRGEWDLRAGVDDYIGHVDLRGKRVLEMGTANGFLCFEMERRGANVTAYDLCEDNEWDLVPYGGTIAVEESKTRRAHMRRINNAWWLSHHLLKSKAQVAYGTVYELPRSLGPVDVSTFGSILLHLRDPFLALQRAAELTTETIIVTDMLPRGMRHPAAFFAPLFYSVGGGALARLLPELRFLPDPVRERPYETWWSLSPTLVERWVRVLGFSDVRTTYHMQPYQGRQQRMFTVVGRRKGVA